jgi:hypothetical protein
MDKLPHLRGGNGADETEAGVQKKKCR